ncbi:hypothetical protein WJX77_005657 [Trebouxia sp. C0004]
MHGFALIMGSVFGHKSAVHIISKCQKLVTSSESQIESSHKLKHWVHEEYVTVKKSSPQHKKLAWLVQAATTRFSSTYNGMLSIQQMEVAFKNMADKDGAEIKRHCLSKDAGRYLILLAKTLKAAADSTLNPDFLANAFTVYNRRWEQMGTPLIRLALFLHPGYRVVGTQADKFKAFCKQAAEMCPDRKYGGAAIKVLCNDTENQSLEEPFSSELAKGELPDIWWSRLGRQQPNRLIAKVARSILSITPHAADPKRAFSFTGMTHSSIRNRLKPSTVGSMAQIKSYLLIQPPDEVEFQTHEAKPKAKQQRTLSADVGSLDVTGLAQYESLNPQPPLAAAAKWLISLVW